MSEQTPRLRAALFDFDGTLVDTTSLILRCFGATWAKVFGLTCEDAEYIQTFGIPLQTAMGQMVERLATEGRIPRPANFPAKVEELVGTYRTFNEGWHDQLIRPFVGVGEMLHELKRRGYRLGVVTSKKRIGAERGMRLYGLTELFDVCLCAEDTENNKPHPEPLLRAMQALKAAPGETVFVGDSTHDIVAGKAAKVVTAAATWGPFARAELEALKPDYLLRVPSDLLAICRPVPAL